MRSSTFRGRRRPQTSMGRTVQSMQSSKISGPARSSEGVFELIECIQGAQVDQIQIGNIGRDLCCNLVQGPLLFPSSQGRAATVDLVGTQGRLDNLFGIDYR